MSKHVSRMICLHIDFCMNTCGVVSESLGERLEYSALQGVPGRHVLPHQPLSCADHDDGDLQLLKLTCSSLQGLHHPMMTLIWMTRMSKVMCYYLQLLADDRVLHGFDNKGL